MRGLDSPWGLRVTGLVGVAVVAAGAYGAGALPGRDPGAGLRGPGTPEFGFWLGLAGWVVGLAIMSGAWWRIGRRLGAVGNRWLFTTGALWALPLLLAPPLASRDVYSYACQGEIWRSGLDPYAVGAVDGGCQWAGAVPDLWQHTPAPYGSVGVALSGVAAAVARAVGGPADHQLLVAVAVLRVVALVGGLLIAVYAGRLARAVGVAPEAARWLGLLSPLVAVHLVSGAHNDALTAGLIVAALAVSVPAAGRMWAAGGGAHGAASTKNGELSPWGSALAAGAFLGLAVGVKVTAVIALPFVVMLVAGRRIRLGAKPWPTIALAATAVTGSGALVFAAASLGTGLGLGWVRALSDTGSLVQWTSLPTGLGMTAGYVLRTAGQPDSVDTAVDVARVCGLAALVIIGLALCWRALRATLRLAPSGGRPQPAERPRELAGATVPATTQARSTAAVVHDRPARLTEDKAAARTIVAACGWTLVAAAILLPVFYPWYALVPLAVLACATKPGRTRTALAAAAVVVTALTLPNGLGIPVLTKLPGAILDVAIVAGAITAYRRRSRRSSQDEPVPADGRR
ncbi:polyprenol phosphomannose-dependent alpha 1,6 mannosyltransferase MptB [Asanoa iriomotensis]|uniref:polyprenol phosphomannose-dependent alpha 1,6 mannosyltransferase MptB n=1 Tax=Asanoa iriomotensis TaxID=234613 RepID=UPI001942672D|nr:polyprenol phosphomannose-dependent alpha 1,6 mannosyltransferase MptB [Asanoa iriomotensis]